VVPPAFAPVGEPHCGINGASGLFTARMPLQRQPAQEGRSGWNPPGRSCRFAAVSGSLEGYPRQ